MEEETKKDKRNLKFTKGQECLLITNQKTGEEIQLVSNIQTIDELIQSAFIIKANFFDTKQVERSYIG